MKFFLGFALCVLLNFAADASCVANSPAQQAFCEGMNKKACKMHSSACKWFSTEAFKSISAATCQAKDKKPEHQSFCSSQDRESCQVHARLCKWQ